MKFFAVLLIASFSAIVISMIRSKHFFKALILTALQGVAAICAVNVLGLFTGVSLSLNQYTIGASLICGTPGVIGLLLIDTIFGKI
ncbi:MAG: pro-sigmaK processing inhibitor BofA family protein [Clostridiales bacterium]|nr:pro-sigmaK processing inhibitor BofA family protein [Clostridiales bacterium]